MKREELLKSKEYWMVKIQNDLYEIIEGYMKENKLNRTQLAEKLHVTKGYITQVLNGDFDHKISKLVELALLCGKAPLLYFIDVEKYISDDAKNKTYDLMQVIPPAGLKESRQKEKPAAKKYAKKRKVTAGNS